MLVPPVSLIHLIVIIGEISSTTREFQGHRETSYEFSIKLHLARTKNQPEKQNRRGVHGIINAGLDPLWPKFRPFFRVELIYRPVVIYAARRREVRRIPPRNCKSPIQFAFYGVPIKIHKRISPAETRSTRESTCPARMGEGCARGCPKSKSGQTRDPKLAHHVNLDGNIF